MTMQTDAAPTRTLQPRVIQPSWFIKILMSFIIVLFVAMMGILVSVAASEGGGFVVVALFGVAMIAGALYLLRPSLEAIFSTKIALWDGYLGLRLPARRKAPTQAPMNDAIALSSIVRLATRIELTHTMGQILQMRQFALLTDEGRWIEYGGCMENPAMSGVGETGRIALAAVAAISEATGLAVEDQGVVEGARKGVAGTPWGGVSLAAAAAETALVAADKNSNLWRTILGVVFLVIVAAKLIIAFSN